MPKSTQPDTDDAKYNEYAAYGAYGRPQKKTSKKPQPSKSTTYVGSVLPQSKQHQFVIEYWARTVCAMKASDIAEILLDIITSYSVPAFRFRYGNEKLIGIYQDGLLCHQLQKKQCSALFGPRMKYDGLDKNMVYKFKFLMKAGNVSIGLVADDYVRWNDLLYNVNDQRHAVIWRNGYYHHNSTGGRSSSRSRSGQSVSSGHVDDVWKDGDLVELEVNLSTLKCYVRNLTNSGVKPYELPIAPLVNYSKASNYMQIVIGFFDDFGRTSWVQGAGQIEVIEQRGEYHSKSMRRK